MLISHLTESYQFRSRKTASQGTRNAVCFRRFWSVFKAEARTM